MTTFNTNLRHFSWHKADNTIVAEISDLCMPPRMPQALAILSHHTGKTQTFIHYKPHKDHEGDITHWEYHATDPQCKIRKVILFND